VFHDLFFPPFLFFLPATAKSGTLRTFFSGQVEGGSFSPPPFFPYFFFFFASEVGTVYRRVLSRLPLLSFYRRARPFQRHFTNCVLPPPLFPHRRRESSSADRRTLLRRADSRAVSYSFPQCICDHASQRSSARAFTRERKPARSFSFFPPAYRRIPVKSLVSLFSLPRPEAAFSSPFFATRETMRAASSSTSLTVTFFPLLFCEPETHRPLGRAFCPCPPSFCDRRSVGRRPPPL